MVAPCHKYKQSLHWPDLCNLRAKSPSTWWRIIDHHNSNGHHHQSSFSSISDTCKSTYSPCPPQFHRRCCSFFSPFHPLWPLALTETKFMEIFGCLIRLRVSKVSQVLKDIFKIIFVFVTGESFLGEVRMRKDLFLRPLVQLWPGCWWQTRERSSWFRLLDHLDHLDQLLLDHQLITTQGGGDQVTWEPDLRHKGSLDTDKRSNEPGGMHCTYIGWPVMASVYY